MDHLYQIETPSFLLVGNYFYSYHSRNRLSHQTVYIVLSLMFIAGMLAVPGVLNAQVGYESQGRFAQAFYDQFRLTPLEYRRLSK